MGRMQITIQFTNLFKIISGMDQQQMDVAEGMTVGQLSRELNRKFQNLPFDNPRTFYTVNNKFASPDQVLNYGDHVRVFQMMAGG